VDGISMPLILLTTFVTILVVVAGWEVIQYKTAQYMAAFLILEGLMDGVFSATDGMLFYVLWEAMLIPMFLIIGVWGGPRRVYATIKFFLYTFLGSVFMLVAIVYMYLKAGSFDIQAFQQLPLGLQPQVLIFIAFLLAFAVKVPMWPVHTWLPDAHVEAPTGGSVILAAIMLKMGGYGFLRFSLPITPDASHALTWLVIGLSLTAIVYIGFVAIVQTDMKKLVAYSSVAHMGFVTLGFFLLFAIFEKNASLDGTVMGVEGGMVQMISHGFISGALFLCVGVLYDRLHTREIGAYGGVVNVMPAFAFFMVLFAMANCGLPGTSGFVGEWMVILAAMRANFWVAFAAAFTLFLGAAYSLWLVKRVLYGPVGNDHVRGMTDISQREFVVLGLCAVPVIVLGVWPAPLLDVMHATVTNLVHQVAQTKLTGG
jgi:NADH-quinone oxidoreductase subunit M